MAKLTAHSFLDLVQRSGLIAPDRMEALLQELDEDAVNLDSPQAIADALTGRELLTPWQANNLLQGKHRGFVLGQYRLLRLLGKGGMGSVYLAQHEMMRRRCAIKVLTGKHANSKTSLLDRFIREARAVAALDHPNIVRAYDINKEDDHYYLVMEYVDGQDLQALVHERGRGLEYAQAADYIRQAAHGLAHAHENGLIHRDIKPANLLVSSDKNEVKILDLGLARFYEDDEDASLTKDHGESSLGTADYLSPEQALNSHEVDTRTDIYSLGCTLYFCLTGLQPFPEGTVAQRLMCHQMKSPKPVEKFRPDVPADLVAIIDRMIAKKPHDRFQTAGEVADVLAAWLMTHTDEQWKQEHPDVFADSSVGKRGVEPTRVLRDALTDTDTELGFAPDVDDEPTLDEPRKRPQPISKQEAPAADDGAADAPAAAEEVEEVEQVDPAVHQELLEQLESDSSVQNLDLLSDPLAVDPAAVPVSSGPAPAAKSASDDSQRTLWIAVIGGGVGVLLLLLVVISFALAPGDEQVGVRPDPPPAGVPEGGGAADPTAAETSLAPSDTLPQQSQPPLPSPSAPSSSPESPPPVPSPAPPGPAPPGPAPPAAPPTAPPTPQPPPTTPQATPLPGSEGPAAEPAPPAAAPGATLTPGPAPAGPGNSVDPSAAAAAGPGPAVPAAPGPAPSAPAPSVPAPSNPPPPGPAAPPPGPAVAPPGPAAAPTGPPGAPGAAGQPKEPARKRIADLSEERARELLEEMQQVSIQLKSDDPRPQSLLNLMLLRTAGEALEKLGKTVSYDPGEDDPAALVLTFSAETTEQPSRLSPTRTRTLVVMTLSAELIRRTPTEELVVWQQKDEVATAAPELLKRGSLPPVLRRNVEKLYIDFVRQYKPDE